MDQLQLSEMVEKYLRGELSGAEKVAFEEMRMNDPELDQMVVEYHAFLDQIENYGAIRRFKSTLYDTHQTLQEDGLIKELRIRGSARIVNLWSRYRRVVTVAASIAGITALFISGMITVFSPKTPLRDIEELRRKVSSLEKQSSTQRVELNKFKNKIEPGASVKFGGTGFIIDPKGYMVTSAHVLKDAKKVYVQNQDGEDFLAEIIHLDASSDIALLKINDLDFKATKQLPYGFAKTSTDLSAPVYTLGYPKDEIVYNEGYLSAKSGLDGDTLSYQLAISANPGNSGGPVLNKNGEVIGILNARQASASGVVFATKSKNIYRLLESIKDAESPEHIRIHNASSIKKVDRMQQVKKVQDYVYMVKVVLN
jgi:S1-C subfamily serine protease